jgi:transposase-like protein
MYKVDSRSQAIHHIIFDKDIVSEKTFVVMCSRNQANHICDTLNSALNAKESAKPAYNSARVEICPLCGAVNSKVIGFPWPKCTKCGHTYNGQTSPVA